MSAVRCPRCEESFRVPDSSLPPGIRLRCPWCTEIFDAGELSNRLPPMAELIDEEGKSVDLHSIIADSVGDALASHAALASAANLSSRNREGLLNNEPVKRIEPGVVDRDGFEFAEDEPKATQIWGEANDSIPARVFDSDQFDDEPVARKPSFEILNEDEFSQEDEEFEDVDEYDPDLDPEYDPDYDPDYDEQGEYEDEYENEDIVEEVVNRVPVEGPVAPRPLSTAVVHDFSKTHVTAKPRAKKSGSAIKQVIGVVIGGLMAVPLAGGVLTLFGQKPDWGFYPFNGTETIVTAGQPMQLSEDRDRPRSIPSKGEGGLPADAFETEGAESLPPADSAPIAPTDIEYGIDLEMDSPTKSVPPSRAPREPVAAPTAEKAINVAPPRPSLEASDIDLDALMKETSSPDTTSAEPIPEKIAEPPKAPNPKLEIPSASSTSTLKDMVKAPEEKGPAAIELPITEPSSSVSFAAAASPQLTTAIDEAKKALRVVIDFPKDGATTAVKLSKSALYASIGNVGTVSQDIKQPETTELIDALIDSRLATEMASVAPNWLVYDKRTNEGLFAVGQVVEANGVWMLKCDGIKGPATVQLKDFDAKDVKSGDRFFVLAKILDSSPPAIVRVVYMQKQ